MEVVVRVVRVVVQEEEVREVVVKVLEEVREVEVKVLEEEVREVEWGTRSELPQLYT